MKLSQWLRGPVPEDDPFRPWLNRITFLGFGILMLWPFAVTLWLYLSGAPAK